MSKDRKQIVDIIVAFFAGFLICILVAVVSGRYNAEVEKEKPPCKECHIQPHKGPQR